MDDTYHCIWQPERLPWENARRLGFPFLCTIVEGQIGKCYSRYSHSDWNKKRCSASVSVKVGYCQRFLERRKYEIIKNGMDPSRVYCAC